jgi:hypothetical protein
VSWRCLAQDELDVVQVVAASLRRLDRAGDSLEAKARVVEDDLDRLHALGGSSRGRTAATDELDELRAQPGFQAVQEPHREAAAFACCEAQSRVGADSQLDATADDLVIAAGMRLAETYLVLNTNIQAATHAQRSLSHTTVGRPGWAAATLVLAASETGSGRPDQAAELALTVLDTIPQPALRDTSRRRLRRLDRTLASYGAPPPSVTELHDRIQALPPPDAPRAGAGS